MEDFRNDWLKEPRRRKDIIFNWVHMSKEQQEFFDFDVNNYGYMSLLKDFDITNDEIEKAINYYFTYDE